MDSEVRLRNNVTLAGQRDAEQTIVFVNGLGTDQNHWSLVAPAFQDSHRLVLFDHAGSVPSNFEYFRGNQFRYLNANGYAQDLLEICAALELRANTILIGHSLGAMVGVLAAVQRPAQFEQIVLIGASPCYLDDEGYRGGFSRADIEAIYERIGTDYRLWADTFANAAIGPNAQEHTRCFVEALIRIPKDMMLTVLCSILQADHRSVLAQVRVPTLIVQSTADYFVPMTVGEYLHAHLPESALEVIDAEGHLPQLSVPEKVIQIIGRRIGIC